MSHSSRAEFTIFRGVIDGVQAVHADTKRIFPRHTHNQFGIGVIERGAQKSEAIDFQR